MLRKRKQPTPNFRMPPPYEPMGGEEAALQVPGVFPYAAMMQVAAEDTHRDYVICRGFDIRVRRFVDYESGNADKPGIPVAKPYGKRATGTYTVAQIYLAVLPLQTGNPSPSDVPWRVGQNPGVSEVTPGHPADLDETVDELYDDDGIAVNWMLVDDGSSFRLMELCLAENHPGRGIKFNAYQGTWSPNANGWTYTCAATVAAIDWRYGVPYPPSGARGLFTPRPSTTYGTIWECVALDCESPGACCPQ